VTRRHLLHLRGPDFGRWLAGLFLLVQVVIGLAVVAVPFLLRLPKVRARIEQTVIALVKKETNLDVKLRMERPTWPPGIVLRDVRVESTDRARPFLTVAEARVTVRPFSLLSGNAVIDGVEVFDPVVDAEVTDGKLTNLPLKLPPKPDKPKETSLEPPIRTLAITHGTFRVRVVDAGVPTASAELSALDLDVDVSGEATYVYDARLKRAKGALHTQRQQLHALPLPDRFGPQSAKNFEPYLAFDDDALCQLAVNVRLTDAPNARTLELRRLTIDARLDHDLGRSPEPSCAPGATTPDQVLALDLARVELELPKAENGKPRLSLGKTGSKVVVTAPTLLATRYVALPPLDGWLTLDLDLAASVDLDKPLASLSSAKARGRLQAHDLRFSQFRFGESLEGDVYLDPGLVVGTHRLELVKYGGGKVTLSEVEARLTEVPGAKKQLPLRATVDIKDLAIGGLVYELGITRHPHVRWDFKEAKVSLSGHLDPLELDGGVEVKSQHFELAARALDGPNPGHLIGLAPKTGGAAAVSGKVAVRPAYLAFEHLSAAFGGTKLAARVQLGFDNKLEVDATADPVDLADASPITAFPIAGTGKLALEMRSTFDHPRGKGTMQLAGFTFDKFGLGDIESGAFEFDNTVVEVQQAKAKKGESRYEVSSMRLDLGRPAGPVIDVLAKSANMALEDFYTVFGMDKDPRWDGIQGHLGFDARGRFLVGGEGDPCGKGKLDLDVTAKVLVLDLFGERFSGGTGDLSVHWFDLDGGGLGMDLDVHSATLQKKGGGAVVVSGKMTRGGKLDFKTTVAGLALESLSSMPATTIPIKGTVDAVAEVGGTLDTMRIAADVYMSPLRVGGQVLKASRFTVLRSPLPMMADSPAPDAKGCYAKTATAPFDPVKYAADAVQGEYQIDGDLFDGTMKLVAFRFTDQRKKVASGKVVVRQLDVGPLAMIKKEEAVDTLDPKYTPPPPPPIPITGKVSFDLDLQRYPFEAWWDSEGSVANLTLDVARADASVATTGTTPTITFGTKGVSVPKTRLAIRFGELPTELTVEGAIDRTVPGDPKVKALIELPNLPLSRLEEYFPKIERAEGKAFARVGIGGTLNKPTWDGELGLENASFSFKGFSLPLVAVNGRIKLDPKTGVTIEKFAGEMGGGKLSVTGGVALNGFTPGEARIKTVMRDVHFAYGKSMSMTFDADLNTTWTPGDTAIGIEAEPASVTGEVNIQDFLYEKPIKVLDVNAPPKPTDVVAYDPAKDVLRFAVDVRAKHGFRAKNNLVDMTMVIGKGGLQVVGTNQRFGLLGDVFVQSGGVFRFRRQAYEIREGSLKFADETKIDPDIDISAATDYTRAGTTGAGSQYHIKLHVWGTSQNLKLDLSSEPTLSQEDIFFLLNFGMTKAEAAQVGAVGVGSAGLDLVASAAGVDDTLKQAIPVIDDIRFGTAYSLRTGRTEPQVTFGKKITEDIRASVTTNIGERREIQANIEWKLSQIKKGTSVQLAYDNVNDISTSGNIGIDIRWRLDFDF